MLVSVELTTSYADVLPASVLDRFEVAEVRNAAAVLKSTNPTAFAEVVDVLEAFVLEPLDILLPGGQKSRLAQRVDDQFRVKGWREGRHDTQIVSILRVMPWKEGGESGVTERRSEVLNEGYKVDNVKARVALDVEWNAKDGNLDRDVGAYRALYDAAIIDVGVVITRHFETILALAKKLGRPKPLGGRTTTNIGKLVPRLTRGDGGGCPILALAITDRRYTGTPESEAEAKVEVARIEAEKKAKGEKVAVIEGDDEDDDDVTLGLTDESDEAMPN